MPPLGAERHFKTGLPLGKNRRRGCNSRSDIAERLLETGARDNDILENPARLIVHTDRCCTTATNRSESHCHQKQRCAHLWPNA